jgi:hypothetical protein
VGLLVVTLEAWRKWATPIRIAANGRTEVTCNDCERFYWLSEREREWSCARTARAGGTLGAATL